MTKWYLVTPDWEMHGMQDDKDKDGLYIARRILPMGSMIPLEWKGLQAIRDLYLPANRLQEYKPTEEDWPILYMLWPSLRPDSFDVPLVENSRIGKQGAWASGWYKINAPDKQRNMSSVPLGVSALRDVEGVCKTGDMAMVGDIVPAAFFAGLSYAQFERLETIGLCSESWLASHELEKRAAYLRYWARPVMERVAVPLNERPALYAKYPAMNPEQLQALPEKRYRKG